MERAIILLSAGLASRGVMNRGGGVWCRCAKERGKDEREDREKDGGGDEREDREKRMEKRVEENEEERMKERIERRGWRRG